MSNMLSKLIMKQLIHRLHEVICGRRILPKLRHLDKSQWWSSDQIRAWQQEQLTHLLHHACENVPYYRQLFAGNGLEPADIQGAHDLTRVPLLTKDTLREHQDDLISTAHPPARRIPNRTGGSTGTPLRFYQDQRQRDWGSANKLRCNAWAGWDFGKRTLRLWGHAQDLQATQTVKGRLRDLMLKEQTFDAFGYSTQDLADLADYLRRKRPEIIVAYASMLAHFAAYLEEHDVEDVRVPDGLITSADMLFPNQRSLIERVLGTKVFDRYGCREVSVIAAECEEHSGMHINADRLIVEFVDDDGQPVSPGKPGRVVITDLFNYAMPFIRYTIGDVAIPSSANCPCGRGLPLMEELIGRFADILTTPEGHFVSASALTTILPQIRGLLECQLVQKADDWLRVNAVCHPNYDECSERAFRQHLIEFFGPRMRITFHYVDSVPRTTSGKRRFSVSEVEKRFS